MRRLVARLGLAVLVAGAGAVAATPAQAAPCTGSTGVTVVVQNGSSADVRCAPGDPGSAGAALQSAGFSVEQVQTQPGAVCKINGAPDTSCVRMPPAQRYWAFHHAPAGGSWSYANTGVYQYDPAPGTVVGFRLGSGAAPSTAPPEVERPSPTQRPRPTTSAPPRTSTSAPQRSTSGPGPTAAPEATSTAPTSATGDSRSPGETPSSSAAGRTADPTTPASTTSSSGSGGTAQKERERRQQEKATSGDSPTSSATSPATSTSDDETSAVAADTGTGGGGSSVLPAAIGGGLLLVLASSAVAVARMRRD